jgi:hypothetical protein
MECTKDGPVRMVPVRIDANLKALTIEELLMQKKAMHLNAFSFLVDEVERDLRALAEGDKAAERTRRDRTASEVTCRLLAERITAQCRSVLKRHEEVPPEQYVEDDGVNRLLVSESLDVVDMAKSKWDLWVGGGEAAQWLLDRGLNSCRRQWQMLQERRLAGCGDGAERETLALALCRNKGLLRERVDEVDSFGEAPLLKAAADGDRRVLMEYFLICL